MISSTWKSWFWAGSASLLHQILICASVLYMLNSPHRLDRGDVDSFALYHRVDVRPCAAAPSAVPVTGGVSSVAEVQLGLLELRLRGEHAALEVVLACVCQIGCDMAFWPRGLDALSVARRVVCALLPTPRLGRVACASNVLVELERAGFLHQSPSVSDPVEEPRPAPD